MQSTPPHGLTQRPEYKVDQFDRYLAVTDVYSGAEVFRVVVLADEIVSLQGAVGTSIPTARLEGALDHVAHFNCSAAVGTLTVNAEGVVTMQHYVNPQIVSPTSIANLAQRFGDSIQMGSHSLATQ